MTDWSIRGRWVLALGAHVHLPTQVDILVLPIMWINERTDRVRAPNRPFGDFDDSSIMQGQVSARTRKY
jgi:hypothetical protein